MTKCTHYMIRLCGSDDGSYQCEDCLKIFHGLMSRSKQNEKLRDIIVDLADLWDGKESGKYGIQLECILENLGIKDVPKFYSNINSYIAGKTRGKV